MPENRRGDFFDSNCTMSQA